MTARSNSRMMSVRLLLRLLAILLTINGASVYSVLMSNPEQKLTRAELHNMLWTRPFVRLAKELGYSYLELVAMPTGDESRRRRKEDLPGIVPAPPPRRPWKKSTAANQPPTQPRLTPVGQAVSCPLAAVRQDRPPRRPTTSVTWPRTSSSSARTASGVSSASRNERTRDQTNAGKS